MNENATTASAEDGAKINSDIEAYYKAVDSLADHILGIMSVLRAPPHMVAIAASQMITAAVVYIHKASPGDGNALLDELANGLVTLGDELKKREAGAANGTQG